LPLLPVSAAARQNLLLRSLPAADLQSFARALAVFELVPGQALHRAGHRASHVYFPVSGIVSLVFAAPGGSAAELAMVGSEGVVGAPFGEHGEPLGLAVVQCAGWAFRLDSESWADALERSAVLAAARRHAQALVTQMAHTAACSCEHGVVERTCRWLLLCFDRLGGDEVETTQALIAARLGVRRAGVSECAHALQAEGLIRYARGRIALLDRAGLERRACACYGLIREHFERHSAAAATV
jgi:CRP-like cAMP-binding protein